MLTILGGGSVGLWLAARLVRAGQPVAVVTRHPESARLLRHEGIDAEDLESGERWQARVRSWASEESPSASLPEGPVVFCTRSEHTEEAARRVAARRPAPRLAVSMQNGVENEEVLARIFSRVLGAVFRQTATRVGVNRVRAAGCGRIVVGVHPRGVDSAARDLASRLEGAGFDVSLSPEIGADKWLKLCVNLMSAPNALVRRADHTSPGFVETKVRLLEEARAVLEAAAIRAAPADARDRTLEQEIEYQRTALEEGRSVRNLPLYNDVWTALHAGSPLESDRFHELILSLAHRHGLDAPANARVLAHLRRAAREGLGPESLQAKELLTSAFE